MDNAERAGEGGILTLRELILNMDGQGFARRVTHVGGPIRLFAPDGSAHAVSPPGCPLCRTFHPFRVSFHDDEYDTSISYFVCRQCGHCYQG